MLTIANRGEGGSGNPFMSTAPCEYKTLKFFKKPQIFFRSPYGFLRSYELILGPYGIFKGPYETL